VSRVIRYCFTKHQVQRLDSQRSDTHWCGQTLAKRYPDDQETAVLHGESLMDLRPWDYWTQEGEPRPGIEAALAGFEQVWIGAEQELAATAGH